jgi:serine/threonine-protein kinase HipA
VALHLVGETINKARSHYLTQTGRLVRIMRGVYVDADDDADATVLRHAVRIAHYLYPRAYLSAASAVLLGPTRDGRLFLSARRRQRTRIRSLEIIQNRAPARPSVGRAVVADAMGEFQVEVSTVRQRFLECFRLRSEHSSSVDEAMREAMAARLVEEYGSPTAAAEAVWTLARENAWTREGDLAERFLQRRPPAPMARNEAALTLMVAWHGAPLGTLAHDGYEWRWTPLPGSGPPLIRQSTPGRLPHFIASLLPEGWLEEVLGSDDERALLRSGKRYLSNIAIVERPAELATLPADILLTRLDPYTENGRFVGNYAGPRRGDIQASFERNLARIYERADTPRLSGIQIKAPAYLDAHGTLTTSEGRPFTHILKPAGLGGFELLPLVEWLGLTLGRAAGLEVPAAALVAMPDDIPPALLVERFDIRQSLEDRRLIALEDFSSILGVGAKAKYGGTMERVARAVRQLSTTPDDDILLVVKRALFAWLIADGDMHLKNLALLRIAEADDEQFRSVRMAPLYDPVTTRVFPTLRRDRMALKVNGKDDRLRRPDFRALARTAGMRAADADAAMDQMIARLQGALDHIALPAVPDPGRRAPRLASELLGIVRARLASLE